MSSTAANLHSEILGAVKDRQPWESKQALYYQMRHEGLRRSRKPHKFAADLHFPLIDTAIEKLKPFYFSQAFGSQRLAQFVARTEDLRPNCEAASDALDWHMREETNAATSLLSSIDYMLLRGRGVSKVVWDNDDQALSFIAVDPLYLIVPSSCTDLAKADWIVEVRQMSLAEYKRNPQFKQAVDGIDYSSLVSSEDKDRGGSSNEQDKIRREGITYSANRDTVIIWEVYSRLRRPDGKIGYNVHTYSPHRPEVQLREPYQHPISFQGRVMHPFVEFCMEIKDVGYYAPRGVAERLGAFEAWENKIWNSKGDLIDYTTKPMFRAEGALPNASNIQFMPGEVLAGGLTPVVFSAPPVDLDAEMATTRMVAEQSIMMPDFGVGGESGKDNKTATEVDYIRTLSNTGVDLKGRIFRIGYARLLRLAWATLVHYRKKEISYFIADQIKVLPKEALADGYHIVPDGSTDAWNKAARVQRSMQRMNALRGNPNVNQEELTRDFLMEDDARKAMKLFVPTNEKAATEMKDEALEILLMMAGMPVAPRLEQDHITRIKTLYGKLEQLAHLGHEVDPMAQRLMQQHLAQHVQMLHQVDPKAAKAITQELMAAEQQQAQQQQGPAMMPAPQEAVI